MLLYGHKKVKQEAVKNTIISSHHHLQSFMTTIKIIMISFMEAF